MINPPSVTIIVLNWNAREFLTDCLTALQQLDYPNFIIQVVDNNSTDDSLKLLDTEFPQIPVIRNNKNLGFSTGNNSALRQLQTDIAVLVNPDVIVSPDWLRQLIAPMREDTQIGVAGCKLYYPGETLLQHAGGYLIEPQALPGHYGIREQDKGQYNTLRDVDYAIGAAMAIRKEVLAEVGLFDKGFFLYFEDADFCFRVRQQGYRVVYVPTATAVHIESATTNKESLFYLKHFHTGRWRFLLKHFTVNTLQEKSIAAEKAWLTQLGVRQLMAAATAYRAALRQWPSINAAKKGSKQMDATDKQQEEQIAEALLSLRKTALTQASLREPEETAVVPPTSTWQLQEQPFASHTPIIGPLIARFREMWNSVAAKWYVRPLIAQQNQINKQVVDRLRYLETNFIDMDREQSLLVHDIAELTVQLTQTNRLLQSIDNRLAHLEVGEK
ncbi:MAG: glycosyltransferase family 2 protein [Chloroflexi bacterium]|nr:glycosyltransferase family 2 protein [Chloroflexota bacterium]